MTYQPNRGRPLTEKDRRDIEEYIRANSSMSTRQIHLATGWREKTLGKIRRAMAAKEKAPQGQPLASVEKLPSSLPSIEELKARRRAESRRVIEASEARKLIKVKVNTSGPFGLFVMGDPHVDDAGCDYNLLEHHIELIKGNDRVLSINGGDLQNNWIGRLARLHGEQSVTAHESWLLAEDLIRSLNWLAIIKGNHDLWTGAGDPIDYITKGTATLVEPHGVRLALQTPNGAETRVHIRHDFPGHSIYSEMHGPKREVMMGFRDHIVVAAHRHVGGEMATVTPDGTVAQLVRISGYKRYDSYAQTLGLKSMPIHPSAFIIINPEAPETSRERAWLAPSVEVGVKMLEALY